MTEPKKYTLGEVGISAVIVPLLFGFTFIATLPFALWKAYVITVLWGWFVVPYFHLPELPLWIAYGLMVIYGLWTVEMTIRDEPDKPKVKWAISFLMMTIGPAISLGVGYLAHHFALHGR